MAMASHRQASSVASPHLHGGSPEAKLLYEYDAQDGFWHAFAPYFRFKDLKGKAVLDIGCGWGGKTLRYAESASVASITGFDLPSVYDPRVPRQVAAARGLLHCTFTEGSAEAMPFEADAFDVAIMDDVMEHVADPERVLAECARVLGPRGVLLIRFPSIRMVRAHHLDRALAFPGLHWVLSLKTWAAGLNDYLARHPETASFEEFDETVRSGYDDRWVTRNLNGLDLASFRTLVDASSFETRHLGIEVSAPERFGFRRRRLRRVFDASSRQPALRERLGSSIVFVGQLR